jgi:ribose transport system ATP-binding protein
VTANVEDPPVLQMTNISKQFNGVLALDRVSLSIGRGEIHGLLGENGSGKSTLIKVLSGYHDPEPGAIVEVNGHSMPMPLTTQVLRRHGVAFVHQNLGLIPELSIAENFALPELSTERRMRIRWSEYHALATEAVGKFGMALDSRKIVSDLAPVDRAIISIVRALESLKRSSYSGLATQTAVEPGLPGLLVLDEPTAFLEKESVMRLGKFLRSLVRDQHSILLVTHNLEEIRSFTDSITVLRDGSTVATKVTKSASNEQLVELIVGTGVADGPSQIHPEDRAEEAVGEGGPRDDSLLIELQRGGRIRNFEVEIQPGDIVGVTGLRGSGWEDLSDSLFGLLPAVGSIESKTGRLGLAGLTPKRAIEWGVGLVPSDRAGQGGIGTLSVSENVMMLRLGDYFQGGILRGRRLLRDADQLVERFRVRPSNVNLPFAQLSGGNQQKVVLAKWVHHRPKLLLLSEPTQGVDVGARKQIFELLRELALSGTRVLLASSDYDELASLCTRVFIISDGRVVAGLEGSELSESLIAEACLSAAVDLRGTA